MKIPAFALFLLSLCIIPLAYCEDKTTIKDKLPSVEFHATPIMDASGTEILIQVAKLKPKKDELGKVSDDYRLSDLRVSKISLFDALHYVAAQAGLTVKFMSDRVVFSN